MIFLSENIENKFIYFDTSQTAPDPPFPLNACSWKWECRLWVDSDSSGHVCWYKLGGWSKVRWLDRLKSDMCIYGNNKKMALTDNKGPLR